MVILQQIKQMKKENQGDNRLAGLVEEFYNEALPHKQQYITRDLDPQTISQKLDLCQVYKLSIMFCRVALKFEWHTDRKTGYIINLFSTSRADFNSGYWNIAGCFYVHWKIMY